MSRNFSATFWKSPFPVLATGKWVHYRLFEENLFHKVKSCHLTHNVVLDSYLKDIAVMLLYHGCDH